MTHVTSTSPHRGFSSFPPGASFTALSSQLASTPPWFRRSTPGRNAYGIRSPEDARDSTELSAHANFSSGTPPPPPEPKSAACASPTNFARRSTRPCVGVPLSVATCVGVHSSGTDGDAFPARPGSVARYANPSLRGSPSSKRTCSASAACVASSGAPIDAATFAAWSTNAGALALAAASA